MDLEHNPFRLNQWVVHPTQDRIENDDGESVTIEPLMMAVLVYLARHQGETVSNNTLINEIWSENFVGENPLYRIFSILRRDLGDDKDNPVFIKNYPRKGYRLLCPVVLIQPSAPEMPERDDTSPPHQTLGAPVWPKAAIAAGVIAVLVSLTYWFNAGGGEQPAKSIGIIAFDDVGDRPETEFLGDVLAEDVLTMLNRIPQLEVATRDASFHYKGKEVSSQTIADALNVNYLLGGSVEKIGDRVTVNVKLVQPKNSSFSWSDSFEVEYDRVHVVQADIALALARELGVNISAETTAQLRKSVTEDNDAYIFYWRGVDYLRRPNDDNNLNNAISMFERSLKFDARHPQAYAGLCEAKLLRYTVNKSIADFEDAERNCHRALTLDRENLGARVALGVL